MHTYEESFKTRIIHEQLKASSARKVGRKLYDPETIVRAFDYFATSRALYYKLRHDFQLPSATTLTRITSSVAKQDDCKFLETAFLSLPQEQKICAVLLDEIYIKKMMTYHGGTVYGKAANNPDELAGTMLGIMVHCLHGGPIFMLKMIPVSRLNADFMRQQMAANNDGIKTAGAKIQAIICDRNGMNQSFFKGYATVNDKPWLSADGTFLLYDFVHLIKNLRNLWLTEKVGELEFILDGKCLVARWQDLRDLFNEESKNSGLVKIAIFLKGRWIIFIK